MRVSIFAAVLVFSSLPAFGAITGTVIDENGVAVAGAGVSALSLESKQPLATAQTDAKGNFSVEVKEPVVELRIAELIERVANNEDAGVLQLLPATKPPAARSPKPAGTAKITGTLRTAANVPIAGAEIAATTPRVNQLIASAITDAKGNYTIAGLAPAQYELLAIHPEYDVARVMVTVAAGAAQKRALIATPLAHVAGFVTDENRRAVAAARVTARGMRTPAVTAPDGRYLIRIAPAGELRIDVVKKGLPDAHSDTLRLAAGERKNGVAITIPGGIALTGRVLDAAGKPVGGASVRASSTDEPVRAAADGAFSLRLQEGTYDLLFTASGFAPKTVRAQVTARMAPLEVTLDPGVEVRGRVTRGGEGVEGVRVFVLGDEEGAVMTSGDGAFRIADLAPGELRLAIRKPAEFIQLTRAVTAPAKDVEIALAEGGRVRGRVVEKATQQPVKSFSAGVSVGMRPPAMQNFTSDDGAFAIDNVPAGSQTLVVSAPGFTTARVANVSVESGKGAADIEVALESGVRITGRVTGPDAGSDEAPVAGATVRVEPKNGAMDELSTLTDSDGTYAIDNVEAGETTLAFSRSGLLPARKTATISAPSAVIDARLGAGASISGVVVTGGGGPVADANVHVSSAADPAISRSATSDAGGAFAISGVAPGHYEVRASKRGYSDAVQRDVDISRASALRLVLEGGAVIAGRVTGLSAADLRTATVQAVSSDATASAHVDGGGSYRIDGAPTGTVRVSARAGEMASSLRQAPMRSLQLAPGETATADFDFTSDITIQGRITRSGAPVPGVAVSFLPRTLSSRPARTTSDTRGEYSITGVDEGAYTVSVGTTYSTSYEIGGSATFDIDLRGAKLTGRVVDAETSAAIANANVDLRRSDAPYVRSAVSDSNGAFAFDDLASGSYEASARQASYGGSVVAVQIDERDPAPLEVRLTQSSGLVLTVIDARDRRPLSAWYHAVSASGSFDGSLGAEPSSIALASGAYELTVGAIGYASITINVSAPGRQTVALTPGGTLLISSTSDAFVRARLVGPTGQPYLMFRLDPAPGQTRVANVAAGNYTLQVIDDDNRVVRATQVTVGEGQTVTARL